MDVFCRCVFETPVGPMIALASDSALAALEFAHPHRERRLDARLLRRFPPHRIDDTPNAILDRARAWLDDYFAGRSADAAALPLAMHGTEFERRVWACLLEVSAGQTTSYGAIAGRLGLRNGARAVGLANGANPIAIIVPCHRVVGADGTLTGYGGGLERKRWLLDHERRWASFELTASR
jgi:O-6-methylguanine DNA methyltransferase